MAITGIFSRILIVCIVLGTAPHLFSQEESFGWLSGGLGGSSSGLSGGFSFTHQISDKIISVRYIYNEEFIIFGPNPAQNAWDVGVLFGKCAKSRHAFASIAAGIGVTGGLKRGAFLSSGSGT